MRAQTKALFAFWFLLGFVCVCFLYMQYDTYQHYCDDERTLLAQKEKEENKTTELNQELNYANSDTFVEKIARERLNLVMPDEIVFYDISEKPQ